VGGQRGLILFPEGRGGQGWNKVVVELCEVLAFFEAMSGSHLAAALSLTENKAGKVSGLHDFFKDSISGRSGGAWPIVGGVLSSFVESCDLDFLPAERYAVSEDMRSAMDYSVLEKLPLGPMI
jgi:hypothetical protein